MHDQTTLQAIARSGHQKNLPLICRAAGAHTCSKPFQACCRSMLRLWYNHISAAGVMSVTLTNAEKQQCYRERHLGAKGTKQRVQHFLSVPTKAQLDRLASYHGYTVTRMIEDLAAAAERKILDRLSPAEGRAYLDGKLEQRRALPARRRTVASHDRE